MVEIPVLVRVAVVFVTVFVVFVAGISFLTSYARCIPPNGSADAASADGFEGNKLTDGCMDVFRVTCFPAPIERAALRPPSDEVGVRSAAGWRAKFIDKVRGR